MKKLSFSSLATSFVSLMIFWLIMSGKYDAIYLAFGVFSVGSVLYINHNLRKFRYFEDDVDGLKHLRYGRAVYYFFWMIGQVIIAGFHVLRLISRPSLPIKPAIITFDADLPNVHARMILGNSITLTPGTITVDITGNRFTVHSIDTSSREGIINDQMPRQVLKLFSNEDRQVVSNVQVVTKGSEVH
jgi:multicomponent Na+:H+ antiporter subunit E